MIGKRVVGLLVSVALALGLVLGASGAIAAKAPEAAGPHAPGATATFDCNDHMAGGTEMMGGSSTMMGGHGPAMMGPGAGMMGGSSGMMGSDISSMLESMPRHHGGAAPQTTP